MKFLLLPKLINVVIITFFCLIMANIIYFSLAKVSKSECIKVMFEVKKCCGTSLFKVHIKYCISSASRYSLPIKSQSLSVAVVLNPVLRKKASDGEFFEST